MWCKNTGRSFVFPAGNTFWVMVGLVGYFVVHLSHTKGLEDKSFRVVWGSEVRVKFRPFAGKTQSYLF